MTVPNWYQLLLISLGAFRTWKLLADDTILDGPRRHVTGWWRDMLDCPWCSGFWIALLWVGAWQAWPHTVLILAVFLAASAVVGLVGGLVTSD